MMWSKYDRTCGWNLPKFGGGENLNATTSFNRHVPHRRAHSLVLRLHLRSSNKTYQPPVYSSGWVSTVHPHRSRDATWRERSLSLIAASSVLYILFQVHKIGSRHCTHYCNNATTHMMYVRLDNSGLIHHIINWDVSHQGFPPVPFALDPIMTIENVGEIIGKIQ